MFYKKTQGVIITNYKFLLDFRMENKKSELYFVKMIEGSEFYQMRIP